MRSASSESVGGLSDAVALGLPAVAAVFASAPDGITIVDGKGRWVYANPAACALLGRPLSELRGQLVLSGVPVGHRGSLLSLLSEQVAATASEFRGVLVGSDGLEREILASTFAIEIGGRAHAVALLRDVTAARSAGRAAAALSQTAAQLIGAATIDEVLAGISRHAVEGTRAMVCAVVVVGDDHTVSSVGAYSSPDNNLPAGSGATRNAAWETLAGYTGEELAEAFSAGGIVIGEASRGPVVLPDARSVWAANPVTRGFAAAVESLDWQASVFAPLSWQDRVFGWLSVFLPAGMAGPNETELAFYTALADQAAVAVTNARLTERARDAAALMERARLARDLHDSVSQALFSMTMHARAAQLSLASAGLDERSPLGQAIGELRALTRGAMAEMRALIFELRPGALAEEGLVAALGKQAAALSAREEVAISVSGPERRLDLDPATEEHLYRIVSEALHNIVKHAGAGRATVAISDATGGLRIEVSDDGIGFDPELAHPGHLGLSTMSERCGLIGAELTLTSVPGAGTTVALFARTGRLMETDSEAEKHPAIRIFLVDDHRVVRSGISAYLKLIADMEVVGEAADGAQALDRIAELESSERLPDVVLMDMAMPVMDGIAATGRIKSRWPVIEVVAMTSFADEAMVRNALEAGAAGYLLKDADADEVAEAIRAALAGQMHLDPSVARLLADSVRRPRPASEDLTPREREVLGLIAQGASNRQIAETLVVSERTARTHVSAILGKLGLASRTQAALWAVREGLLPIREKAAEDARSG